MGDAVVWSRVPEIEIASNRFINVPTIIQFEQTPLLQFEPFVRAGFRTSFPVYASDGNKIAVVKGARVFLTEAGRKARVKVTYTPDVIACELEGRTILELRKSGPSALRGSAELYAPEGYLIRATLADLFTRSVGSDFLRLGGTTFYGNVIENFRIGILLTNNEVMIGVT